MPKDSVNSILDNHGSEFFSSLPNTSLTSLEQQQKTLKELDPDSIRALIPYWKKYAVAAYSQSKTAVNNDMEAIDAIPKELRRASGLLQIAQVFAICASDLEKLLDQRASKGK